MATSIKTILNSNTEITQTILNILFYTVVARNSVHIQLIDFTLLHLNKEENCKETFGPLSFDKDILTHCSEDNYVSSPKYSNISICMKANKNRSV